MTPVNLLTRVQTKKVFGRSDNNETNNIKKKQSYTLFKGVNLEYRLPGIAIRQPLVARLPADVIIK